MQVQLSPEQEAQFQEMASRMGRTPEEVIKDVLSRYLAYEDEFDLDPGVEEAWRLEINQRAQELDSGQVNPVRWDEVRRELRAKFPG